MSPELCALMDCWLPATRIIPISAIEWTWSAGMRLPGRQIPDTMWFWIRSGTGWCWLGDESRTFRLHPGDLFLVPQEMPHGVFADADQEIEQCSVHFFAHLYSTVDLLTALGIGGVYTPEPDAPYAAASVGLAREYARKTAGWQEAMAALLWQVLLHIVRHHSPGIALPGHVARLEQLRRLLPALSCIEQRLADPELRVADLAEQVHLSEVSLRKLFLSAAGVSPVEFIRRQRIARACTLLRTTELSTQQIAGQCGYNDLPFFYRCFRQVTGTTPRQYRLHLEL